ncbi:MAG: hypothetical protein ACRDZ4_11265 [Egibacteraceae bacterium]
MARGTSASGTTGLSRVRVPGAGPLTGKERRLTGTAHSRKEAEQLRTRLLSEVDKGRTAGNNATVAQVLERWLETTHLEMTTRYTYERYVA